MTEIFEIGVSLALQDGVSDAIGQARRDVAALEQAVRESGLSLRSLREVGTRAASVAFEEPRREAAEGPVKRAVPDVPLRTETGVGPRSEAIVAAPAHIAVARTQVAPRRVEPNVASPLEVAGGASEAGAVPGVPGERDAWMMPVAPSSAVPSEPAIPAREPAPLPGAGSVADMVAPLSRVSAPLQEPAEPATAEQTQELTPPEGSFFDAPIAAPPLATLGDAPQVGAPIEAAVPVKPPQIDAAVSAREMTPLAAPRMVPQAASTPLGIVQAHALTAAPANREADAAEDMPLAEESSGWRPGAQSRLAQPIALVSALRLSGGMAPVTQDEDEPGDAAGDVAARDDEAGPGKAAVESVSPSAMPARAARGRVTAPGARDRSPEQAGVHETGPNEGDVFLDGMLVGRWMSRFLNREAGRASAGPTGFDARRGRLLPGVTVGG
jgi:hypothetical protein